ncbi:MAG: glycerol-3-phosphate 1-O-acyltransferase PlsY [Verrucomicrobiia bacterium]
MLVYIVMAMAAYLLGSIPTGYLVARARGIDIRTVGSGNIGATNAFRILGIPAGSFVLVADGLKGFAASAWLADFVIQLFAVAPEQIEYLRIVAGICAVLGHNFTCWLKFKGGKGIATSAGVYFALAPLAAGISLGTWVVVFALGRYVSVASIAAAVALPTAVWLTKDSRFLGIVTTALGLLAIYKHKGNIRRLLNGTERRLGQKPATPEATK